MATARAATSGWWISGTGWGCFGSRDNTLLAVALAALAVTRPRPLGEPSWTTPLRRLQSGHIGDYVAWMLVGTTLLATPALPGILNG